MTEKTARLPLTRAGLAAMTCFLPGIAMAEGADPANTAWILTSTALVLFMTLPGLALFYGGLVRSKNVLSVLMQCFAIAGIVSILWLVAGYSLAFGEGNAWIGDFSKVLMGGVGRDTLSGEPSAWRPALTITTGFNRAAALRPLMNPRASRMPSM